MQQQSPSPLLRAIAVFTDPHQRTGDPEQGCWKLETILSCKIQGPDDVDPEITVHDIVSVNEEMRRLLPITDGHEVCPGLFVTRDMLDLIKRATLYRVAAVVFGRSDALISTPANVASLRAGCGDDACMRELCQGALEHMLRESSVTEKFGADTAALLSVANALQLLPRFTMIRATDVNRARERKDVFNSCMKDVFKAFAPRTDAHVWADRFPNVPIAQPGKDFPDKQGWKAVKDGNTHDVRVRNLHLSLRAALALRTRVPSNVYARSAAALLMRVPTEDDV